MNEITMEELIMELIVFLSTLVLGCVIGFGVATMRYKERTKEIETTMEKLVNTLPDKSDMPAVTIPGKEEIDGMITVMKGKE